MPVALKVSLPPEAAIALDAVVREAPMYASLFGEFLFEKVLGVPWNTDVPSLSALIDEGLAIMPTEVVLKEQRVVLFEQYVDCLAEQVSVLRAEAARRSLLCDELSTLVARWLNLKADLIEACELCKATDLGVSEEWLQGPSST